MALDDQAKDADALFDEFLDPAIQKILDEADLMEASDEEEEEGSEDGALGDEEQSDTHDSGTTESEEEEDASPALSGNPRAGQAGREAGTQAAHHAGGGEDEEEPIGRRTRTRVPMEHVSLEALDQLLGEEPEDELFDEEGHEYQQFLRVLRGEDSGAELGDEEDDEDFVLDWDELIGTAGMDGQPGGADGQAAPSPRRRSERRRSYEYKPKTDRPGHQERPLQSTLLLQARRLAPLLPHAPGQAPVVLPHSATGAGVQQLAPCPAQHRQASGWTVEQVMQLHRLLGQHIQLLMTTFCAAAALPGFDAHVGASGSMIHALQALPGSYRSWLLLDAAVAALTDANSVAGAVDAMRGLPAIYSAAMLPQAGPAAVPRHEWLPGEDALLARALLRFGMVDTAKARTYFLPSRAEADIAARIRRCTRYRARDNPVKAAAARVKGPLTPLEAAQIAAGLAYYGKQPGRWEMIVAQFMPYRSPAALPRIWSMHQSGKAKASQGHVHWTLLSASGQPPADSQQLHPVPGSAILPQQLGTIHAAMQPVLPSASAQQPMAPALPSSITCAPLPALETPQLSIAPLQLSSNAMGPSAALPWPPNGPCRLSAQQLMAPDPPPRQEQRQSKKGGRSRKRVRPQQHAASPQPSMSAAPSLLQQPGTEQALLDQAGSLPAFEQLPWMAACDSVRPSAFTPYRTHSTALSLPQPPDLVPPPEAAALMGRAAPFDDGGFGDDAGGDAGGGEADADAEEQQAVSAGNAGQDMVDEAADGFAFPEGFRRIARAERERPGGGDTVAALPLTPSGLPSTAAAAAAGAPGGQLGSQLGSVVSLWGQENTLDAHARMLDPESHAPAKAARDLVSPGAPVSAAEVGWQASPGLLRDVMPASEDASGVSPQENGLAATVAAGVQQGQSAAMEAAQSDAEQVIEGVRTHWTQGEDRDILHAALKCRGNLTEAACSSIMARARDVAESWPLPRTERQIRARLEWLAARLVVQTKGSTQ